VKNAANWIKKLRLAEHPEGGYFRETYRAKESTSVEALPARYAGRRAFSTSIYFLLKSGQVSHFHRLRSDEVWHFYAGSPLRFHVFEDGGAYRRFLLGPDPGRGAVLQAVLPRGALFAAEPVRRGSFSLCGCTVAPGFDFADFEFGRREDMLARFPRQKVLIRRLTLT